MNIEKYPEHPLDEFITLSKANIEQVKKQLIMQKLPGAYVYCKPKLAKACTMYSLKLDSISTLSQGQKDEWKKAILQRLKELTECRPAFLNEELIEALRNEGLLKEYESTLSPLSTEEYKRLSEQIARIKHLENYTYNAA